MRQSSPTSPSVARAELGSLLKRLRERADLTGPQVDSRTGISPTTLSRVEAGQRRIKPANVQQLLDLYRATDAARLQVSALLEADGVATHRRPWWRRFFMPPAFGDFLAQEREAIHLRTFEPSFPPGRSQTPEIARLIIAGMRPDLVDEELDQLVDLRMRRQEEPLDAEQHLLLGEGALRPPFLPAPVARRQLLRLLDDMADPQVTLRVLPQSVGYHPGHAGPFVIMTFPVGSQRSVWVELLNRSHPLRTTDETAAYEAAFTDMWDRALTPEQTRALLERMIKELDE